MTMVLMVTRMDPPIGGVPPPFTRSRDTYVQRVADNLDETHDLGIKPE